VDPVVSVDPPDPWDPLAWPEPLARLDARYGKTNIPVMHLLCSDVLYPVLGPTLTTVRIHCSNQCCVFRDLPVARELLDAMEPLEPR